MENIYTRRNRSFKMAAMALSSSPLLLDAAVHPASVSINIKVIDFLHSEEKTKEEKHTHKKGKKERGQMGRGGVRETDQWRAGECSARLGKKGRG